MIIRQDKCSWQRLECCGGTCESLFLESLELASAGAKDKNSILHRIKSGTQQMF